MKNPYIRLASGLYAMAKEHLPKTDTSEKVKNILSRLNPEAAGDTLLEEYYVKKTALSLMVVTVGVIFGVAVGGAAEGERILGADGIILRGEFPEKEREIQVQATVSGTRVELPVNVANRQLTDREAEEMLGRLEEELPHLILGENEDLQNVKSALLLTDVYEEFPAYVEWDSDCPEAVDSWGEVGRVEEPCSVVLTAKLSYGELVRECNLGVVVQPVILTPEEQLYRELEEMIDFSNEIYAKEERWQLPVNLGEEEISWRQKITDKRPGIWLAALGVAVAIFFCSDRDLEERLEKKRRQMRMQYPELLHKLVLFAEAGMTLRGSFQRLATEYEEVALACNELNAGVPEREVYENLGRRIGLQEYIRLGTLMNQNLKRGNAALLERLREEADKAAEEQLQTARKGGEEAGTKLLVPMVMQLAVVMVMIMVPVFMTM